MDNESESVPQFNDEQRLYFQQQLAKQTGKNLVLAPEMLTALQRAEQYRAAGDYLALKNDTEAKHAFINEYGSVEYGKLNDKHHKAERARQADEARVKLEERKKRLGIR